MLLNEEEKIDQIIMKTGIKMRCWLYKKKKRKENIKIW